MKGIGRWTAEMYLMFSLNRPDLLPLGDAALEDKLKRPYNLPETRMERADCFDCSKMEAVADCSFLVSLLISQKGEKRRLSVLKSTSC